MQSKNLRDWKKVFEEDLPYISYELKELVQRPCVVILEGDLGAGKTTFTKVFTDEQTLSPTYSILSETSELLHADFYRLENKQDVFELELNLYLDDKAYFFVEWGKKFISTLQREVPEEFSFYLMQITLNPQSDQQDQSRNFSLSELTFD